jgi:hypothetical protein
MRATDTTAGAAVQPADEEIKRRTRCAYQKFKSFAFAAAAQRERKVKEHATCSSEEKKNDLTSVHFCFERTALQDGGISFSSSSSPDDFPAHPLATHITSTFRFPSTPSTPFVSGTEATSATIGCPSASSRPLMIRVGGFK